MGQKIHKQVSEEFLIKERGITLFSLIGYIVACIII